MSNNQSLVLLALGLLVGFLAGTEMNRSNSAPKPCQLSPPTKDGCPPCRAPPPQETTAAVATPPEEKWPPLPLAITPIRKRDDIARFLNAEGFKTGAELGVQKGYFAKEMLTNWPNCESYLLVDLWGHQQNYADLANVDQNKQDQNYQETLNLLKTWESKLKVCRNYTTICADLVPDDSLDFIYVDARHDYKGVYEDLVAWWPKLKKNGVFGGHDYVTQAEVDGGQDWTLNYDGTRDETREVVVGAVNKFFLDGTPLTNPHYRQPTISYKEGSPYVSWFARR